MQVTKAGDNFKFMASLPWSTELVPGQPNVHSGTPLQLQTKETKQVKRRTRNECLLDNHQDQSLYMCTSVKHLECACNPILKGPRKEQAIREPHCFSLAKEQSPTSMSLPLLIHAHIYPNNNSIN